MGRIRRMSEFDYRGGELFCEGVRVADVAADVGTPVFIYSAAHLLRRYREVDAALAGHPHSIRFSVKSNGSLAIARLLAREGAGCDIVSGGELFKALRAGIPAGGIAFAGVGKGDDEIRQALTAGIDVFNCESEPELSNIDRIAGEMGARARVGLRINPDVDARTHALTTTGRKENKFGVDVDTAMDICRRHGEYPNVDIAVADLHLGSPITSVEPWLEALAVLRPFIEEARAAGCPIDTLDLGGGLGIVYSDEVPPTPAEWAEAILPRIANLDVRLIVEFGRYITGNSGVLVGTVLYVKEAPSKTFVIADVGMTENIRPALYGAYHRVDVVDRNAAGPARQVDVVGPVCESSDFQAKGRQLPLPSRSDLLAIFSAGAYCFSMSSQYLARPRAAEVLVCGDRYLVTRRRETYDDLIAAELDVALPAAESFMEEDS